MSQAQEPVAATFGTRERSALAPARPALRWARKLRAAALILLGLSVIVGLVFAWLPDPAPVDLATVSIGPMQVTVDEDGRTRVKDRYMVSAPLLANLTRIELRPGDRVLPGQVLARLVPLEPPLLDARTRALQTARVSAALANRDQAATAVARTQAALEYAQNEVARERTLHESGASAERLRDRAELEARTLVSQLASAEFAARVADYEVRMARMALDRQREGAASEKIEIVSPVEGQVLRVLQESAAVVQPGMPLVELGDLTALEVVVDVLTSEAVAVEPGASATVDHWGGPRPLLAHVRAVEPSAFTRVSALGVEEQRVNVLLDLDTPRAEWAALRDGYRVETQIVVWSGSAVLSAPASAVFRERDHWSAFEARSGHALLVPVELGRRNAERVEIVRGLREGAQVIEHPSQHLTDGARVVAR
ncbi:MAG TPA: HlyD family efflux transporter periplasmic adaptor subunit [Polyangiales bacterium]|nr:HlyD family efflux transporter periplasmic adaptor subunit [Polyangiales bacterium]